MKRKNGGDYAQFKSKITLRFFGLTLIAIVVVFASYMFVWRNRLGDWIVSFFRLVLGMREEAALNLYNVYLRGNKDILLGISVAVIFLLLLRILFHWIIRYFMEIDRGIDALLNESDAEINLPPEMLPLESKLNAVKRTLQQRALEAKLAEQRKNDLVMYLAHDIRTPLTSIIGYLSLLDEAPDMPTEQKAKYVHITLDKAYRLEKMVNEFFEITRYNLQQPSLSMEKIDLYYMLVQLCDELSPVLSANGNTIRLKADESLTVYGDSDKLARVFNNVLKNAAAYSNPNTEVLVSAEEKDGRIEITCQNQGKTIPPEKLAAIFEKFYRLDEARTSNTGGSGLGLAIAKQIVSLHNGTIAASSENGTITFTIVLPSKHSEDINHSLGFS